jgi:hypothetical protein
MYRTHPVVVDRTCTILAVIEAIIVDTHTHARWCANMGGAVGDRVFRAIHWGHCRARGDDDEDDDDDDDDDDAPGRGDAVTVTASRMRCGATPPRGAGAHALERREGSGRLLHRGVGPIDDDDDDDAGWRMRACDRR